MLSLSKLIFSFFSIYPWISTISRADILAHLPPVKDKFVVDIGAGIGRFTTVFAQSGAARVVSTDFVDTFVAKNRERNGTFANVEWRVGDALGLEFEQNRWDRTKKWKNYYFLVRLNIRRNYGLSFRNSMFYWILYIYSYFLNKSLEFRNLFVRYFWYYLITFFESLSNSRNL